MWKKIVKNAAITVATGLLPALVMVWLLPAPPVQYALSQPGPGPQPQPSFSGGTLSQELILTPSTTVNSGLNVAPGVAPTTPVNGDIWATASGIFIHAGGITTGPVTGAAGTTGQLQINNSGALSGIVLGGDCTFISPTVTCLKTNGVAFTTAATTALGTTGATIPLNSTLSTSFDSVFGSTRGSLLERGATGWGIVAPGTSGLPWVSGGAGVDPGYSALTAAGIANATITTTQIALATITGGNIASSTVANSNLTNMAADTAKCNPTGGSAVTQDCTLSQLNSFGVAALSIASQQLTGGAVVTPSLLTPGNITLNCGTNPLQRVVNTGAFTITAPALTTTNDQNCALRVINGTTAANAGAVTLTGFSGKSPGGATFATTPTVSAASVTFTNGSNSITWTANGLSLGSVVFFATTGTLPTNFATATLYYVVTTGANSISVSATPGGTAITAGSAGSGTQTAYVPSIFDLVVLGIDGPVYAQWNQVQ